MRVRLTAKAGPHSLGVTFLQTNFAPVLDLDQHFMRDTVQTGPTPGFTLSACGHAPPEGPFNAKGGRHAEPPQDLCLPPDRRGRREAACARKVLTNLATKAFRRPATPADAIVLMTFYTEGRKDESFDNGIEMALARL
jgi:hypothetical protein